MKHTHRERRSIQRFIMSLTANLVIENGVNSNKIFQTVTKNVSSDGAFYFLIENVPIGTEITSQIFLNSQKNDKLQECNGVIYVEGIVIRNEEDGIAVKFMPSHTIISKNS